MGKKKKVRVDLRKNRTKPPRPNDWTRDFQDHGFADEATVGGERAGIGYLVHASYPGGSTLRAIELATGRIAATRDIARHVADLIPLR